MSADEALQSCGFVDEVFVMHKLTIEQKNILAALQKHQYIQAAYVFGSIAKGTKNLKATRI